MKKSVNILSIFALTLTLTLFSCGGGEKEAESVKLETKDVKGTIMAADVTVGKTDLHNDDGKFEVPNVKFNDDCRIQIAPVTTTFDEEVTKLQNAAQNFGDEIKEEKKTENTFFYHVKSDFGGEKKEGYNFIVWIKGEGKNYLIKGEGSTPFDPIKLKEDAEKAFAVAQTFKAE